MIKVFVFFIFIAIIPQCTFANASGAGTCVIDEDYVSITGMNSGMFDRRRNFESGPYSLASNMPLYFANTPVEITIAGPDFTGILFAVVDEQDTNVGSFDSSTGLIHDCNGSIALVTHSSSFGDMISYTLFWIPPVENVGKVTVVGYILKGNRGDIGSQEFYRFTKNEASTLSLNSNAIFNNGFE